MSTIVDPTNENVALVEGKVSYAVRIAPVGTPLSEMVDAPIIGYGNMSFKDHLDETE